VSLGLITCQKLSKKALVGLMTFLGGTHQNFYIQGSLFDIKEI